MHDVHLDEMGDMSHVRQTHYRRILRNMANVQ